MYFFISQNHLFITVTISFDLNEICSKLAPLDVTATFLFLDVCIISFTYSLPLLWIWVKLRPVWI